MTLLTVANCLIRQDEHGRYSLNDLYRASGGAPRNKPSEWMRNKQTKALIAELESEREFPLRNSTERAGIPARSGTELISEHESVLGNSTERAGIPARSGIEPDHGYIAPVAVEPTRNPATYVVKELVYAYAMWISPAFHLKVIRAYDAMVSGTLAAKDVRLWRYERAYFTRFPNDEQIRSQALDGLPYWYIAQQVSCHVSTVGRAVKRMVEWGLLELRRLQSARRGMGSYWRWLREHRQQLTLGF